MTKICHLLCLRWIGQKRSRKKPESTGVAKFSKAELQLVGKAHKTTLQPTPSFSEWIFDSLLSFQHRQHCVQICGTSLQDAEERVAASVRLTKFRQHHHRWLHLNAYKSASKRLSTLLPYLHGQLWPPLWVERWHGRQRHADTGHGTVL